VARDAVVVAHVGIARVLLAALCGVPPEAACRVDVPQGRILLIEDGRFGWC